VRTVRHILLVILAFLVQTTWIHQVSIFQIQPDLVVLVLVFIALRTGPFEATLLGFAIGLIKDAYAPPDLGLTALAKSIIGFAAGYTHSRIQVDNPQVQVVLIFVAVLVHEIIYYIGYSGISLNDAPYYWWRYGLGRAVYTALCGLVYSYALVGRRYLPV
jgi:rod shape-determining protein MreD